MFRVGKKGSVELVEINKFFTPNMLFKNKIIDKGFKQSSYFRVY